MTLLDYCGVHPDRYKMDGALDTLFNEAKAEQEAFTIAHSDKQPASGFVLLRRILALHAMCTPLLHLPTKACVPLRLLLQP